MNIRRTIGFLVFLLIAISCHDRSENKIEEGGFHVIATASSWDRITIESTAFGFLVKSDGDGNEISMIELDHNLNVTKKTTFQGAYDFIKLDSGYIVASGELIKLNHSLDTVWSTPVPHYYDKIVSKGTSRIAAMYSDFKTYLDFFSLDGYLQVSRYLPGPDWDFHAYDIITSNDSNYFICGSVGTYDSFTHKFYVLKTNANGDSIWSFKYDKPNTRGDLYSIKEIPQGGLIAVGESFPWYGQHSEMFAVRLTVSGDSLWTIQLKSDSTDLVAKDVAVTSEGDFIGAGTSSYNQLMVARIGQNGSLLWKKLISPTDSLKSILGEDIKIVGQSICRSGNNFAVLCLAWKNYTSASVVVVRIDEDGNIIP